MKNQQIHAGDTVCLNSGSPKMKVLSHSKSGRVMVEWSTGDGSTEKCVLSAQCLHRAEP
jgi:uncharacterized protein YodC (DUF2158 family)